MVDLLLIGCGKSKLANPIKARHLYTGNLFRARRGYAEHSALPWLIISAQYGAVHPDQEIAPYDLHLGALPPGRQEQWARRVWYQIANSHGFNYADVQRVEVHAGATYVEPLRDAAPGVVELVTPLEGLQMGEQLGWYRRRQMAAIKAANRTLPGPQSSLFGAGGGS